MNLKTLANSLPKPQERAILEIPVKDLFPASEEIGSLVFRELGIAEYAWAMKDAEQIRAKLYQEATPELTMTIAMIAAAHQEPSDVGGMSRAEFYVLLSKEYGAAFMRLTNLLNEKILKLPDAETVREKKDE